MAESRPAPDSIPFAIGFSKPLGRGFREIILGGKKENDDVDLKIFQTLSKHRARVVWQHGRAEMEEKSGRLQFSLNLVCDLSRLDCSPDDLLIELRRLKFVNLAKMTELEDRFFPEHLFPPTLLDGHRVLLIPSESLVSLETKVRLSVPEASQNDSSQAFFEAGVDCAKALGRMLTEASAGEGRLSSTKVPSPKNALTLARFSESLKALGLGTVTIQEEGDSMAVVTLSNLPSSASNEIYLLGKNNNFIQGILAGVVESLKANKPMKPASVRYDRESATLRVTFLAQSKIPKVVPEPQDKKEHRKKAREEEEEDQASKKSEQLEDKEKESPAGSSEQAKEEEKATAGKDDDENEIAEQQISSMEEIEKTLSDEPEVYQPIVWSGGEVEETNLLDSF